MSFSIIAAIAANNVIGKANRLPWNIPEDLEYFYRLINGKTVIMGHKTYDSISGAIEGSQNVVFTHNQRLQLPDCVMAHSLSQVLVLGQDATAEMMVIGGSSIYRQLLPFVDKMYLTFINREFIGDSYFPLWQQAEWMVTDKQDRSSDCCSYSWVILQRIKQS